MYNEWVIEALKKEDFVRMKDSNKTFLRLQSVGGLTLVAAFEARWVRDSLIEEITKHATTTMEQDDAQA